MKTSNEMGFATGIPKGKKHRVAIRFCSQKQYVSGNHEKDLFKGFSDHQWKPLSELTENDSFDFVV